MEQWKDVVGYEGLYQISDLGRVRSVDRVTTDKLGRQYVHKGRIRRLRLANRVGHLAVDLYIGGIRQTRLVHRLVAAAWIGPCLNGQQVRHGPNGVADNSVSNLCYGTSSEDGLDKRRDGTHGGCSVKRSDGTRYISMSVAAEDSGCSRNDVWRVCNGKRKTAGHYGWKYI